MDFVLFGVLFVLLFVLCVISIILNIVYFRKLKISKKHYAKYNDIKFIKIILSSVGIVPSVKKLNDIKKRLLKYE